VTASQEFDPDSTPNNNVAGEDDQASITLIPGATAQPPFAVNNSSLHNPFGPVTLNATANDTGPNNDLDPSTVDLDSSTPARQTVRVVPGEGFWQVDDAGNVTFNPEVGLSEQPTPINYTAQDQTGLTSNQATISQLPEQLEDFPPRSRQRHFRQYRSSRSARGCEGEVVFGSIAASRQNDEVDASAVSLASPAPLHGSRVADGNRLAAHTHRVSPRR
jgi:Surface adhesin CshA repetitive domain